MRLSLYIPAVGSLHNLDYEVCVAGVVSYCWPVESKPVRPVWVGTRALISTLSIATAQLFGSGKSKRVEQLNQAASERRALVCFSFTTFIFLNCIVK